MKTMSEIYDAPGEPASDEPSTGALAGLWRRLPAVVRAVIVGSAVGLLGVMPWQGLVMLNLKMWPAVPWSVPAGLLWLGLYWRYLGGWGWPRSTAAPRRQSLRAHALPPRVWRAALWAGGLAIAALSAVEVFALRFAGATRPVWFSEIDASLPPHTVVAILLMVALASGLIEEAAYRGYMQTMIERRHGPWVAIPVVAVVFTLAHFTTYPDMSILFFLGLLTISVAYGLLAWLSGSILPGLVLHATGDAVGLLALWALRGTVRSRFAETGPDLLFWLDLLAIVVLGGVTVWAYRRLARVARGKRQARGLTS